KHETLRDDSLGKPNDWVQYQIADNVKQILPHPDEKGPRRKTVAPQIVGKMSEPGIIIVNGVTSDILVEKDFFAKYEVAKYQHPDRSRTIPASNSRGRDEVPGCEILLRF